MTRTLVTANVHFNDDTLPSAEKVTNFVSLTIGDVNLFLMTSDQAARLALAAAEAITILKEMESTTNVTEMMRAGEAWIRAIYDGSEREVYDFTATYRWDSDDWRVVMSRHGSFIPTKADVAAFQAKYASSFNRGLRGIR